MWFNNIKSLVQKHTLAGKPYPFLSYDDEAMAWFIDFRKIGKDKIKVIEVEKAMVKISSALNLQKHLIRFKPDRLNKKIAEGIQNFYTNRASSEQIIMLDFQNCCDYSDIDFDSLKTFSEKDLQQTWHALGYDVNYALRQHGVGITQTVAKATRNWHDS